MQPAQRVTVTLVLAAVAVAFVSFEVVLWAANLVLEVNQL